MTEKPPSSNIETREFAHLFYSFCSFVSILNGKKMNFPTVFLKILQNKNLRDLYMKLMHEESEFAAIQKFIRMEPSIAKSKYVTKYLNKNKKALL